MGQCMKTVPLAYAVSSQPEFTMSTWPGPEAAGSWGIHAFPQLVESVERSHLFRDPLTWLCCIGVGR